MPVVTASHTESHFNASDLVRDVVIGMSDGLTVPFALAAGISGALAQSHVVVTAGVAELAAGAIAMGLGGFLAAQSDKEHYVNELRRERDEIERIPDHERREVVEIFEAYGLTGDALERVVDAITADPQRWTDFMMRFELGLEKPQAGRARRAAIVVGGSYAVGGLVPLLPYMLMGDAKEALIVSAIVTSIVLTIFGVVKGHFTGVPPVKAGLQTLLTGGLAAIVAYAIARLVA